MALKFLSRLFDRRQPVEHKAFFDGAHAVDPKPHLEQINAVFDEKAAKLSQQSTQTAKKHEAILDHVRNLLPQAESEVEAVDRRLNGNKPQCLMPVVMAVAAVFMAIAEVVLLAPAMDALGVSERALQYFTAAGIVLVSSSFYHMAWEAIATHDMNPMRRRVLLAGAICVTAFLILWGIMRGQQVAFSAKLAHSHLDEFLTGHPFLASALFIFLTTMVPIGIATAAHYALHHLRDWRDWKTSHTKLDRLNKARVESQKQLDTERERHNHALRQLGHESAQWRAAYRNHYELGRKQKAFQEPVAMVYLKSAGVALLAGVLLFWAPPPITIGVALAAGIAAFAHFRRQREYPNPTQYACNRRVDFAPTDRNVTPTIDPAPPLIEATTKPNRRRKGLLQ